MIIKESVDVLHVFKIIHSSNAINGNGNREDVGRMKEYNQHRLPAAYTLFHIKVQVFIHFKTFAGRSPQVILKDEGDLDLCKLLFLRFFRVVS